jgi:hypothetical protein
MNMALLCAPQKDVDPTYFSFLHSDSKKFQHMKLWIFVLVKPNFNGHCSWLIQT